MTLYVEEVVDGGMGCKEALSGRSGFETLHLAFTSSDRLVRILGPVVLTQSLPVACCQADLAKRRTVRSQLVGHQKLGSGASLSQQFAHQPQGGLFVASRLEQDVENLAFVIDGAPEILMLSPDPYDHFVEVPARRRLVAPNLGKSETSRLRQSHFFRGYTLFSQSVAEASIRLKSEGFLPTEDSKENIILETDFTQAARVCLKGFVQGARIIGGITREPYCLGCSATMPSVSGLNHITLAVADLDRSISFYRDLLGCRLRAFWPDGAYLEAGSLWLCLSRDEAVRARPHPDYTHLAFSVAPEDFAALSEKVRAASRVWKDNRSEGDSLYFLDPDGHKLELHVGSLQTRLDHYA